jgi:proteasome accessory factor A
MMSLVDDAAVDRAMAEPPRTRAALRGRFLGPRAPHGRDVTVDWVHLKLNGEVQRTVMCKDPLIWEDERVDRLIEEMVATPV